MDKLTSKAVVRALAGLIAVMCIASCQQGPTPTPPDRHQLKGEVVSVDKSSNTLVVDHEDIPGFMSAMTMPYTVKPTGKLDDINPGDTITADVVVQPSDHAYWLENIVVTGHAKTPPSKPTGSFHVPAAGESVPDFVLTNQDGKHISFRHYRGKALLVTFIYTRCPFSDYCPRVSGQFSEIDRQLQSKPELFGKVHLLSISFDPDHDTPKVLRDYGFSCSGIHTSQLFKTWEFAVVPATELPKIAKFFGLTYQEDNGLITHSLSTAVIGPDGKIFQWYHGSDWQASDLMNDAAGALGRT